jgi:hypothetical protein
MWALASYSFSDQSRGRADQHVGATRRYLRKGRNCDDLGTQPAGLPVADDERRHLVASLIGNPSRSGPSARSDSRSSLPFRQDISGGFGVIVRPAVVLAGRRSGLRRHRRSSRRAYRGVALYGHLRLVVRTASAAAALGCCWSLRGGIACHDRSPCGTWPRNFATYP